MTRLRRLVSLAALTAAVCVAAAACHKQVPPQTPAPPARSGLHDKFERSAWEKRQMENRAGVNQENVSRQVVAVRRPANR